MNGCKLCALGVGYEKDLSQRQAAEKYGVGKASVGRHRKHLGNEPTAPATAEPGEGYALVRMSIREEDGSWYRYEKAPEQDLLSSDDLEPIFTRPVPVQATLRDPQGHTEVLAMSDLQVGKARQAGGGTAETLTRARVSIEAFAARCEETKPWAIILVDGGDPIENTWNTPEQMATNDLELVEQIRVVRRLFAETIYRVASLAQRVVFLTVPSNHGRVRTGFKANAGSVNNDYGLDINHALEEVFENRAGFSHVRFVRPDDYHETAVVQSSGTKLAVNHGHHSKGPAKHGEWWKGQDHGRRPGWDADILLMNHYHSFRVEHSGDSRWIISASSSDPGSDWFSQITGEAARQGMTAFSMHNGQWSNIAIL